MAAAACKALQDGSTAPCDQATQLPRTATHRPESDQFTGMHTLGQSTDHAAVAISRRLCSCCQCPNTSLDQCMWIVGMSVRLCTSKLGAGRHADQGKERTSPHTHIQCRHQHHQEHNQHHQHVRAVTDTHTSVASPSTFVKSNLQVPGGCQRRFSAAGNRTSDWPAARAPQPSQKVRLHDWHLLKPNTPIGL